jgi:signal-transduction protein with cAMP-binding, CBS, and nucleotidyltransferase domain
VSEIPFVPVREAMTRDPARIDGLATVAEALARMRALRVGALVVERRDERDEHGLLLVADIAREVIAQGRSTARTSVYEVMTKPVVALDAGMDIRYAVRLMTRLGLSHALVLEGRDLAGIVTLSDIALAHLDRLEAAGG